MNASPFELERYGGRKSRYTCPNCEKPHQFTRYLDTRTGEPVGERVGICNRAANCGYHYTPKQHFADNPNHSLNAPYPSIPRLNPSQPKRVPDTLPWEVMERSLGHYADNPFVQGLTELLTEDVALALTGRYFVGTSKGGGTVFWQVNERGAVQTGKIIHYDAETLKRIKQWPNGMDCVPQWAHNRLRSREFQMKQCLFGQHLLATDSTRPVAIVEAEKTAIICSVYLPDYLWLATGGCGAPQFKYPEVIAALQGHELLLLPDTGVTDKWKTYAKDLRTAGLRVKVFDDLEASDLARPLNWDLADEFLAFAKPVTLTTGTVKWALTAPDGYPAFWDYPTVHL